jgi:hypothetical protein
MHPPIPDDRIALAERMKKVNEAWIQKRPGQLEQPGIIAKASKAFDFTPDKIPNVANSTTNHNNNAKTSTSKTDVHIENITISGAQVKDAGSFKSALKAGVNRATAVHSISGMD